MGTIVSAFPEHVERWVALRTCARWEKQIAAALARCDVTVFLPLLTRLNVYLGKRQTAEVPLFSGYVFCAEQEFRGNPLVPQAVRKRVAQVLCPPDYRQLRRELREISQFLASRRLVQERTYGRPGDVLRVVGGGFAGECGVIRRLEPVARQIVLEIRFLGIRVDVEFEEHLLEKV